MGAVAFIWLIPLVLLIFAAICVNIFTTVCIDEFGLFEDVLIQHTNCSGYRVCIDGIKNGIVFMKYL